VGTLFSKKQRKELKDFGSLAEMAKKAYNNIADEFVSKYTLVNSDKILTGNNFKSPICFAFKETTTLESTV